MALYKGTVSLFSSKHGPRIAPDASGDFDSSNAAELLDKIIEVNQGVNMFSLWLDGHTAKAVDKQYSTTQLKKFRKECSSVELVHVKRPFPQVKLKLTFGEALKVSGMLMRAAKPTKLA